MEIGAVVRVAPATPAAGGGSRNEGAAQPTAAPSELPARAAVPPVASTGPAGYPSGDGGASGGWTPPPDRKVTIDPATQAVVSRVYDGTTGELRSQAPDQAMLRLKAYAREVVHEIDLKSARRRVERLA